MAVKKTKSAPRKGDAAAPKKAASAKVAAKKETAPAKAAAAKKPAAPKATKPEPKVAKVASKVAKAEPAATKTAATKKAAAAPKKVAATPKLSAAQTELLKAIGGAGESGYLSTKKAEARTIEALRERKLVKKGPKDKASGNFHYLISKTGKKHLASAPTSATPASAPTAPPAGA